MNCQHCGNPLTEGDLFCGVCGAKVEQQMQPNAANLGEIQQVSSLTFPEKSEQQPGTSVPEDNAYKKKSEFGSALTTEEEASKRTKKIILIIIAVTAVIIAGIIITFVIFSEKSKEKNNQMAQAEITTTQQTAQSYDKNAKEKTTEQTKNQGLLQQADDKLRSIIKSSKADEIELALIDVDTGEMSSYGNSGDNTASALVVYPVLYAYAHLIDKGSFSASASIPITKAQDGRGILGTADEGDSYTISKLFSIAFEYSDNTAINTLIYNLGFEYIENTCREAGYSSVRIEKFVGIDGSKGANNTISATDLAKMMREMLKANGFGDDIINKYGKIQSKSVMGMGEKCSGSAQSFNGYTDYVYNETVHLSGKKGEYVVVLISNSNSRKHGLSTAQEVGEYLEKCFD